MNVIHFLGFYPEIGGPVRSTGNLIKSLRNRSINSMNMKIKIRLKSR